MEHQMKFITRDFRWSVQPGSNGSNLSDPTLLASLGRDLRTVYTDVLKEPIPDYLASIVRRLESRETRAS
jgi:hypothetical protein